MKRRKIAVLLTCYNRKDKTLSCLASFFKADLPVNYTFDVFLTDDGSTDGTSNSIKENFPSVNIIEGNGSLFWAGGMRLSWLTALQHDTYDAFLLLNDDVILKYDFINTLLNAEEYSVKTKGRKGIYSGATIDSKTKKVTYGGSKIKINHFIVRFDLLSPNQKTQDCEITNANILWVDNSVVSKIGILDKSYTHGIADYDYSLKAYKKGIPVFLAPNICGTCTFDHGNNWVSGNSLKKRIEYLKSPKGLAYKEYLLYIKKHFPLFLPYSFIMLWVKTLFPFIWDRYKSKTF